MSTLQTVPSSKQLQPGDLVSLNVGLQRTCKGQLGVVLRKITREIVYGFEKVSVNSLTVMLVLTRMSDQDALRALAACSTVDGVSESDLKCPWYVCLTSYGNLVIKHEWLQKLLQCALTIHVW